MFNHRLGRLVVGDSVVVVVVGGGVVVVGGVIVVEMTKNEQASRQARVGSHSFFPFAFLFLFFLEGRKNKRKSSRLLLYSECPFLLFGLDSMFAA